MIVVVAAEGFNDLGSIEGILLKHNLNEGDWLYVGSFKKFDDHVRRIADQYKWHVSVVDLSHGRVPDEKLAIRDERMIGLVLKYQFAHMPFPPKFMFFTSSGDQSLHSEVRLQCIPQTSIPRRFRARP